MPTSGPGTELTALLTDLGIHDKGCQSCVADARWMDRLGVAGCREPENHAKIVAKLRAKAQAAEWRTKLKAAKHAAKLGLWFNPLDPAPGLADEAIRRAAEKVRSSDQ